MQNTKMKSLPLGMIAAALAATLLIDATAYASDGRERRSTRGSASQAPAASKAAEAPAPAAGSSAPVCFVNEEVPVAAPAVAQSASDPAATSDDGRQRRSGQRSRNQSAPLVPAAPIFITKIVPCESPAPVAAPELQRPGLLTEPATLLSSEKPEGFVPVGDSSLAFAVIPEPSILALFGVGAVGIALVRRRRAR